LNVVTGGKLHLRVVEERPGSIDHRGIPIEHPAHSVMVAEGSLLHRLVGASEIEVNSHHHEGVATIGDGVAATALASDGLVEAIEVQGHPFALGVQWHAEMLGEPGTPDWRIFEGLIRAAGVK
jgi:putative glutamine amidotransferase